MAINIAALAETLGLPPAALLMAVEPAGCAECGRLSELIGVPYADLSKISGETRVSLIVGDQDDVAGESGARGAWKRMTNVPPDHRDYVLLQSDGWGTPNLVADHFAPETAGASAEIDALDWFGTSKLFDLLTECAFFVRDCADAQGGSPVQLDMGRWSDGKPVTPPTISVEP